VFEILLKNIHIYVVEEIDLICLYFVDRKSGVAGIGVAEREVLVFLRSVIFWHKIKAKMLILELERG
jgi:hypothetical protein